MNVEIFLVKQKVLGIKLVEGEKILGQIRQALSLEENDTQVFLLHFRRDGPVRHGLHISFDGGKGGAEIVGDVGHEFLLVILHIPELRGHVVQGCGEIAHLILGADRDLIVQIAGGILGCSLRDLAKRPVDKKFQGQKDDKRQKVDHQERDEGGPHQDPLDFIHVIQALVDQKITGRRIAVDHRGDHGDHILLEVAVVVPGEILGIPGFCRVEILDLGGGRRESF